MLSRRLAKLEEQTAPARLNAYVIYCLRRSIKQRADEKKCSYLEELNNYLENFSADIRVAIKKNLELEREEIQQTGAIKPFNHFSLTEKEIEAETLLNLKPPKQQPSPKLSAAVRG